jgi:hypothetical protein
MHPQSSHSRRGQSLIEAMIALSILTVGFLGISSLLARAFFLGRVVSDEVTANYLAAEGIEIAKNLIDHDTYESFANNNNFFWGKCFGNFDDVEVDYTTTADPVNDCNGLTSFTPPGHPLLFDPKIHLYSYNPNPEDNPVTTNFTREIQVSRNSQNPDEITVNSIVRWSTGTFTGQSLNVEDHFYNWLPK